MPRTQLCETWVCCNVLLEYHVRNTSLIQLQLLTYLFSFFFSLAFSFVSYSSRCGFLFFLSFVRITWDGRPQLLTYLIFFFSLFKHRQIVFSLAFSFVSYSFRRGFLFFFFLLSGSRGWEATIVDLSFFFSFFCFHCLNTGK